MTEHERAQKTEALELACKAMKLRNRVEKPERGWRLIDIIGAPRRAEVAAA